MSIATQVKRLQNVRNQIRTKMVALGLSKNTDLLQDLADDLDGVNKISPTNNGTTDPGTGYTNVETLGRSTSTRYIKVPKGYNDADRKFTVSGVANGAYSASVSSHTTSNAAASSSVTGSVTDVTTTTKPSGTDGTDYYTITPKLSTTAGLSKATGKATIDAAGYLDAGNKLSSESSKSVEVTASQGDDYYLQSSVVTKENPGVDPGASYLNRATVDSSTEDQYVKITGGYLPDSKITFKKMPEGSISSATIDDPGADYTNRTTVTPAKKRQYVKIDKGYLPNGKITVEAISSSSFDTSGVTATADTVLKDYKFVDSNGITVTGTIATATSNAVSGNVSGSNPDKILLTTGKTSGSSSTTATAEATVAKRLYTGSSDIVRSLTSKTLTATAEATLATATTSSTTVPSTLPAGTVTITPSTDNTKRIYSDTKNNGFITNVVLNPMSAGAYSASVASHTTTNATASSNVSGSIVNVTSATKPTTGTDGADYFTITPKLTTAAGSSKATGKATIDTAGYLATGDTTSTESSKTVGVTASQGSSFYLKKGSYSASVASHTTSNATAGSSVTGSITGVATTTKPAGTDGADYYTITPKLTTGAGSSKATGKATVDTAGYLITGNTTSEESSKSVGVTASPGDSYYLKASSVTKEDPGTSYANKATVTPSTSAQYVKVTAGYLPNSKIKVEAIPSPYFDTSKVTATAGTVLKDYKFVDSSGATVTGTIATATSSNVSGSVSGSDPEKITLTTEKTSGSSSTTATASVTVTKELYTGSSNIEKDLTSKDFTATAEAKLATSVSGSTPVPSTLPAGTVTITPNTDNTKRIYSDSTNKGFITNVVLEAMPTGSFSASVSSHTASNATASSSVTGSITGVTTTTAPSGTDGADYYTITPYLETHPGSSKATGKATIGTAGYLSVGSDTSLESSIDVNVSNSQGKSYYLKASSITKEKPGVDPGTDYTNKATVTPSTDTQYVKVTAGYLPNSKIKVEAIPSPYFDTSVVTAAASDVLSGKKFVNSSGTTVTGTIATATSDDVSGSVSGSNPEKITLTTEETLKSSTTTATAKAIITKGLYTGSSNIEKDLTSQDFTATAEATLAASVTDSTTVSATLPPGTVTITPSTDNVRRIYSDSKNKGFITNVVLKPMSASSVTIPDPNKDPGTDYTNQVTVTPSTSAQYVKVTAGYLPNSKITVEAIPNQKGEDDVTATVTAGVSDITSINASQVTDGVTVTASASGSTVVPVGYYSTQVSKTTSDSKSTTIKPKLAGTNGSIELTAGTSAFTKTSTADYSNGFITSVKVNPTPSETKEFTPTMNGDTISPTPGGLLSSVTVKGVPYFSVTLSSGSWKSDSNVTIGKYYYNVSGAVITASNNLYVVPRSASTSQSFGVYAYSQSKASGASTGTLQFRAMIQPTSDLTYTVYYLS